MEENAMPVTLNKQHTFEDYFDLVRFLWSRSEMTYEISPGRFAQAYHIDLEALAVKTRIPLNEFFQCPTSKAVQDYFRNAVRVVAALSDMTESVDAALYYYRNFPWDQFEYQTAEEIVIAGKSDEFVLYLIC